MHVAYYFHRFNKPMEKQMANKQDTVVNTWTGQDGNVWRELRVWCNPGFRYFVQREIQPGVWG